MKENTVEMAGGDINTADLSGSATKQIPHAKAEIKHSIILIESVHFSRINKSCFSRKKNKCIFSFQNYKVYFIRES